jgi:hypothetical protein
VAPAAPASAGDAAAARREEEEGDDMLAEVEAEGLALLMGYESEEEW